MHMVVYLTLDFTTQIQWVQVSQFFYNMEKEKSCMVMFPSEMKHEVFPF